MRKQYHFRPTDRGVLIWDVDRLVAASQNFPRRELRIADIREVDEAYWATNGEITCRGVVEHAKLIAEADLAYPIILSADGRVMDGMHRVGKALLEGRETVEAVQFSVDPEPDYVDVDEDDLPYEEEVSS